MRQHKQLRFTIMKARRRSYQRRMAIFSLVIPLVVSLLPYTPPAHAASPVYEQVDKIGTSIHMGSTAALAIDSAGNYYTSTYDSNGYIRRFSPAGEQLPSYGTAEQTWTGEPGMHGYAYHIAFKSNGEMYVADSDNLRINIYSPTGEYLRAITEHASGQPFAYNWRFAFGPDDKLYVIDDDTSIHIFDSNDAYLSSFSNTGTGDGQFTEAWGIDIDESNNIFIGDYGTERIIMYDSSWNFIRNIGSGTFTSGGPDNLHINNGYIYTMAYWEVKKIQH